MAKLPDEGATIRSVTETIDAAEAAIKLSNLIQMIPDGDRRDEAFRCLLTITEYFERSCDPMIPQ